MYLDHNVPALVREFVKREPGIAAHRSSFVELYITIEQQLATAGVLATSPDTSQTHQEAELLHTRLLNKRSSLVSALRNDHIDQGQIDEFIAQVEAVFDVPHRRKIA